MNRSGSRLSWVAGLTLGAAGGFLLLELPTVGLVIVLSALVIIARAGRPLPGVGGLVSGIGVMWVALFGRIKLTCTVEGGCFAPSIDTYLTVAVVVLMVGLALSGLALARAKQP